MQSAFNLRALPLSYGAMRTFVAPAGFDPATTSEMNGMIKIAASRFSFALPTVSEGWFRSIDLLVMSQTRVPLRHFAIRLVAVWCLQCRQKSIKGLIAVCDQSFQSTNAPALPTAGSVGFEPTHSDYIVGCSPFELLPV